MKLRLVVVGMFLSVAIAPAIADPVVVNAQEVCLNLKDGEIEIGTACAYCPTNEIVIRLNEIVYRHTGRDVCHGVEECDGNLTRCLENLNTPVGVGVLRGTDLTGCLGTLLSLRCSVVLVKLSGNMGYGFCFRVGGSCEADLL